MGNLPRDARPISLPSIPAPLLSALPCTHSRTNGLAVATANSTLHLHQMELWRTIQLCGKRGKQHDLPTIFNRSWALKPRPHCPPFLVHGSQISVACHLTQYVARGIKRSRVRIRPCTLGNHPSILGQKCLVVPGSATPACRISFLKVRMASVVHNWPAVCTSDVYS